MGFASFVGRVFFASIFILSAWQMFNEFGVDGGPAAKELIPKLDFAKRHISSRLHVNLPDIEVRQLVATFIALKGLGAILFVFGHGIGAFFLFVYLLVSTPILYDFYNYGPKEPQYNVLLSDFLQNSIPKRQLKKRAPKPKAA
ncbi:hypothetical protein PTKIN_Ptkin09bG0046600 [Pterospermum kingtungense]